MAKDFQDRDEGNIRNDSPTCSKEGLRIALAITASNHWMCKSMDIKTPFLQSKELDQLVYLDPPKEANVPPGYIWKLSKCVYGLTDASRSWYLTLKEELLKSRAVVLSHIYVVFWKQTAKYNCYSCQWFLPCRVGDLPDQSWTDFIACLK